MSGYLGTKAVLLSTTSATVGGDSTVGGDLTVDTNTLYVDSTNNRVGVGTASPSNPFQVGTSDLIVDSSGNVGIGTSSPTQLLTVGDTGTTYTRLQFYASTSGASTIHFGDGTSGADNYRGYLNYAHDSNSMQFATDGSERMRIDGSGNVGIGTSSPAKKLDVSAGDIRLNDGYTLQWGGTNNRISGSNSSNFLQFVTSGVEAIRIDSSGNVGIGTNSPAKQLEITKSARATITSLTDGATITPDFDAAQNFAVTLGGNRTLANPSNIDAGQTGSIFVTQDGTGSRTLSFGSYWDFAGGTAPTLSTAAGAVDRIDYIVRTGTSIHAVATLNLS